MICSSHRRHMKELRIVDNKELYLIKEGQAKEKDLLSTAKFDRKGIYSHCLLASLGATTSCWQAGKKPALLLLVSYQSWYFSSVKEEVGSVWQVSFSDQLERYPKSLSYLLQSTSYIIHTNTSYLLINHVYFSFN